MEDFLQVGIISSPHGVRGEVKVYPTTDDVNRFKSLKQVKACRKDKSELLHIRQVKFFKNMVILKFDEIHSMDEAEAYRNVPLMIGRDQAVKLAPGEYFLCDLIGMEVSTDEGEYLGTLTEVIRTGANDVYVVRTKNEKEVLIPNIKDCIIEVELEKNTMTVHLLEGLL